jgi:hypothetical protein
MSDLAYFEYALVLPEERKMLEAGRAAAFLRQARPESGKGFRPLVGRWPRTADL